VSFDELMRTAADERGPFGDHLRAMPKHPELC
jgi:hypothetical protein